MQDMREPEDIFNPRHYDSVHRRYDEAHTLPAWCYTSKRFYDRERERIFFKFWNCIGHHSRVPNPGDYFTQMFCGVPLIVVRGTDMKVRVFINSCPHRGSEMLEGEGNCKMIKCPYHAWAFDFAGKLYATPLIGETDTFKMGDHNLVEIRLETWAGFMWINFDPDAQDLMSYLGDLPQRTAPWKTDEMVCVSRREWPVKANWKLYMENFSDGYHVPFVHQHTLNFKKVSKRDFHDPTRYLGNYLMHYTYFDGTRGVREHQKKLPQLDLPDELKIGTFFPVVHANTMMGFAIDMVSATEIYPDGPENCTLVTSNLVPKSTAELPDFEEIYTKYLENGNVVRDEDVLAAERQQKGLSSRYNTRGCFTPQDKLVHDYNLWILDRVVGNAAP
jgi:phenylpropionate dioxygenase-like ring-hydroxylating dioxygenase large terminal subunit